MKFDFVCLGGVTEDIMFHTGEMSVLSAGRGLAKRKMFAFEAGDKILSDREVLYTAGGGGANSSVSLARLGLKVALVGAVGSDTSAVKLVSRFNKEGITTNLLQKINNQWTGLSLVVSGPKSREHIIFTHRAANNDLKLTAAKLARIKTDWFYLTSLAGKNWQFNLGEIFKAAGKKGIKVAWNPGGAQLAAGYKKLAKYLKQTELLILNRHEAEQLVGRRVPVKQLLKTIASWDPKVISVSEGKKGAHIYSDGKYHFAKIVPGPVASSVGAGDAFGSSLAGGLAIFKNDLAKALKLAMVRSGYVVRQIGAQEGLLTLRQVKAKFKL